MGMHFALMHMRIRNCIHLYPMHSDLPPKPVIPVAPVVSIEIIGVFSRQKCHRPSQPVSSPTCCSPAAHSSSSSPKVQSAGLVQSKQ